MKNILIVDDDEAILESLEIVVSQEGYEVVTLLEAGQVVPQVLKQRPDLIVLDMLLSGANGQDVVRELKKDLHTKKIPIIMFSAHPSTLKLAKECGADDFLEKPFDINDLLSKIKRLTNEQNF